METPKMTKYTGKYTYGIDDLKSYDPYYVPSGQWPYFSGQFGVTEDEYNKDIEGYKKRIKDWNENHIKELKDKGLYLTPYEIGLNLIHNPLFDDPKIDLKSPFESHRVVFLDFETKQKITIHEEEVDKFKKQRSKVTLKENDKHDISGKTEM